MPPIIHNAGPLLEHYDVLFCDIWGVVHNGVRAYTEGCAALARFRQNGGTVILVSNAPRTAQTVRMILDQKSVSSDIADVIVSSGELARDYARANGFRRAHHIGPDRDLDVLEQSGMVRVNLAEADAIFCTGLINDRYETGADYLERLRPAAERGLTMICANPDLMVDVGGALLPCAGAIGKVYEDELDGHVFWAGKPYAAAYQQAEKAAHEVHGGTIDKSRILAIGDSVRTDIAGAAAFGLDSLFIAQGIHHDAVMPEGELVPDLLTELFDGDDQPQATAAMTTLRW